MPSKELAKAPKRKEGGKEIASQSTGAHKMSDVAVGGVALYSGPPNHPNDQAWMAARDKLASSVQADAYTVAATWSLWAAERIVCPADRPHSTAHPLQAKDRRGTIPTDESLDLPSRSGVEENDQFETTRDSGSSTNV